MTRQHGLKVRRAERHDVPALVEFNRAMARETEGKDISPGLLTRGVENLLKAPVYGFYVVAEHTPPAAESETGGPSSAEAPGPPAGGSPGAAEIVGSLMVTFEWSDWRNGLFWWIQSVYVRPDFRRRGVFRALYDFLKQLAARPGYRGYVCGFRLYVERHNTAAQQTYERLGMSETYYKMYEEEIMSAEEMANAQEDDD